MFEWTEDEPSVIRPPAPTRAPPGWLVLALAVIATAWFLATGWQWVQWARSSADLAVPDLWSWFGSSSSEYADAVARAAAQHHARLATLVGTLLPGIGLALALVCRRALVAVVFGGGALLCLCLGLWMHAAVTPDAPEPAPPRHCQERSGGEATCPGG